MLPSVKAELERKLEHIRDGARRIQNVAQEREHRIVATNIATTAAGALKLVREA